MTKYIVSHAYQISIYFNVPNYSYFRPFFGWRLLDSNGWKIAEMRRTISRHDDVESVKLWLISENIDCQSSMNTGQQTAWNHKYNRTVFRLFLMNISKVKIANAQSNNQLRSISSHWNFYIRVMHCIQIDSNTVLNDM